MTQSFPALGRFFPSLCCSCWSVSWHSPAGDAQRCWLHAGDAVPDAGQHTAPGFLGIPPCTPRSSPGVLHHTTPSFPATLNAAPAFVFFFLYFELLARLSGKVCCNFTEGNVVAQCGCLSNALFVEIISPGYIDLSVNQLLHENKKGNKKIKIKESPETSREQNSPLSKWLWGIKRATAHQH